MNAGVICVFGIRGYGKTTFARGELGSATRLLAWDPFGEHSAVQCTAWRDAMRYLETQRPFRFRLSVVGAEDPEGFCCAAWVLARWLGGRRRAGFLLAVEEADLLARPGRETPHFRRLVAQGRHYGVSILSTSRRPAEVSRLLTSQAARIVCFRIHEPADLAYLRGILGDQADQLPTLGPFEYLDWTPISVRRGRLGTPGPAVKNERLTSGANGGTIPTTDKPLKRR